MNRIFDINGEESTIEELSKIYNLKKEDVHWYYNNGDYRDKFIVVPNEKLISIYHIMLKNNKHYIGRTIDVENRMSQHKRRFRDDFVSFEILHSKLLDSKLEQVEIKNYRKRYGEENVVNISNGDDIFIVDSKFTLIIYQESVSQMQIQAYRYKKTTIGIRWEDAAQKYGVKVLSIKRINSLYNELAKHGLEQDFEKVEHAMFMGLTLLPSTFEWLSKSTGSAFSAIKQLKEYMDFQEEVVELGYIDTTEFNPVTGEALVKEKNMYMEEKMSYDDLMKAFIDVSERLKKIEEK